jgi:hypothetical protein
VQGRVGFDDRVCHSVSEQFSPLQMNTSHSRKLWLAIVPMLIAVTPLITLAATSMLALSGVRAYVGGEGLWSKAQKDAIRDLVRYARSADASDYQRYQAAISVPLGDRAARAAQESTSAGSRRKT